MSVNLLDGLPGAGKTFFAIMLAIDYMKAGLMVYTNIFINFDADPSLAPLKRLYRRVERREEILGLRSGVLIIDEAPVWFNARSWQAMPEEMQFKFLQHRKDDLHLWMITQNGNRVDPVLRELIYLYAKPTKVFEFNVPWTKKGLRSPFVKTLGLGINQDPDYARFVLQIWTSDQVSTSTMKPRLVKAEGQADFVPIPPVFEVKAWLTPKVKTIFDTKQIIPMNLRPMTP